MKNKKLLAGLVIIGVLSVSAAAFAAPRHEIMPRDFRIMPGRLRAQTPPPPPPDGKMPPREFKGDRRMPPPPRDGKRPPMSGDRRFDGRTPPPPPPDGRMDRRPPEPQSFRHHLPPRHPMARR